MSNGTKSMAALLGATMAIAGGIPSFGDDKTPEPRPEKRCSLPACTTMITYSGGYCCAEHARLHRGMVREQNIAIQRNMKAKRKRYVSK